MIKVLLLHAPQNESFKPIYLKLESHFSQSQYQVTKKPAKEAAMPDLAAADIIIFVSGKDKPKTLHSDYKEILRSAQGINLAGRVAGFISLNTNELFEVFIKKFCDSEISIFQESLEIEVDIFDEKALKKWTEAFIKYHKEYQNERV